MELSASEIGVRKGHEGVFQQAGPFMRHFSLPLRTHAPSWIFIDNHYMLWSISSVARVPRPALHPGGLVLFAFLYGSFREFPSVLKNSLVPVF
jgi:hypothetical protein